MTKTILAALIASVAAASVFAADVPTAPSAKTAAPVKAVVSTQTDQKAGLTKVATTGKEAVKTETKAETKAAATSSSAPAVKPAPATQASAPAAPASAPAVKK